MAFAYDRTVHFSDTDAAGVVFFGNLLFFCHEAYEASLAASAIDLRVFLGKAAYAIPITSAQVHFYRPMFCGDRLVVQLVPQQLSPQEFQIDYEVFVAAQPRAASTATTRHVCIDTATRSRREFPDEIRQWLQQFSILNSAAEG